VIAAGTGVIVVGAGGAVALGASSGDAPGKRYATVGRATLTQVVEASGTITSSAKATPSFPVSGTVRRVDVRVGQSVTKGQVLAKLDTGSLQDAVDSAQSALAHARQKLAADEDGQTSSSSSSNSASSYSGNTASYTALTTSATSPTTPTDPLLAKIRAAQQGVLAAQRAVDTGQAAVDAVRQGVLTDVAQNAKLRDAQHAACTAADDGSTGPATDACTSARADYETFADTLTASGQSLDAKVSAQDDLLAKLDSAIIALDKLLAQLSSTSTGGSNTGGSDTGGSNTGGSNTGGSNSKPTTGSSSPPTTGSSTTNTNGQSNSSSSTTTASAAQLAADQAQIDAARAGLRSAKQDRAAATLRSPISGRVAAIGLSIGSSAGSGTVTIVGTGVPKVTAAVPLAQIRLLKLGQPVTVAADGVTKALHGTITAIGLLSSTSGSATTFPVTVQLAADAPALYDGAGADVRIVTGTARDVVAVPNSAIHPAGRGRSTVTVVRGSATSTVPVSLGVAGAALTQVMSGLKVGDRVVLADYSQSVPASSTNGSTGRRGFLTGGNFPVIPRPGG